MLRRFPTALALLVMTVCACADESPPSSSGVVSDSAGIRIVELPAPPPSAARSFALDPEWMRGGTPEVGRLGDVEPMDDGRVALLDELAAEILVLGPDGALETKFGGPGDGPGEFSPRGGLSRLVWTGSRLLAPDIQLQRVTAFSAEGEVMDVEAFPGSAAEGPLFGLDWRLHPHGGIAFRVLASSGDLVLRWEGEHLDTLQTVSMARAPPNRLLPPTVLWDVDPTGRIALARSDEPRVELREPGAARPNWIARRPHEAPELSAEERGHLEDLLLGIAEARGMDALPAEERRRILDSVSFASTAPILASLLADPEGRIWVRRAAPVREMGPEALRVGSAHGFGAREWDILGPDGTLEEVVALPAGFTPRGFAEGCLVGILEDGLGVQSPARVCP